MSCTLSKGCVRAESKVDVIPPDATFLTPTTIKYLQFVFDNLKALYEKQQGNTDCKNPRTQPRDEAAKRFRSGEDEKSGLFSE